MEEIDTLFMVGTNFPYTKHLPEPGKVTGGADRGRPGPGGQPAADRGAGGRRRQGRRWPALLPLLQPRDDGAPSWTKYQKQMGDWREDMAALENPDRDPIAPQYLCASSTSSPPTTRS